MMIDMADQVFEEFEGKGIEKDPKSFETKLFKMMVKFTSSVVMSGFLGNDSLK